MIRPPPRSPLFPYTPLSRSDRSRPADRCRGPPLAHVLGRGGEQRLVYSGAVHRRVASSGTDRKSTRLKSSHQIISYAVFCFKKKKNKKAETTLLDTPSHSTK